MTIITAAKYPFTSEAKEWVMHLVENGWEINDYIIEKAKKRIREAFENRLPMFIVKEDIAKEEVLSYAVAKIIIATIEDPYIRARYSIGEAKRAFAYLSKESRRVAEKISKELGLEFKRSGKNYLIHFVPFLENQPGSPEYLLINRDINNGYVKVNEHERDRLIEEAIRKHIERTPKPKAVPKGITDAAESIKKELPKPIKKGSFYSGDTPPCIDALMKELYEHKNLPHNARVYLTMYFHRIGWKDDAIVELFSNSPDFNIRITEYQVKYISSHNYSVPNCSTVQSYGLCTANCGIKNPLQFKKKTASEEKGKK